MFLASSVADGDGDGMEDEAVEGNFIESVGRRLRSIRRQQHLSLEDVEQRSAGRWSASAIGAYERGYRNLSLGRLRELADFYSVPISVLVGEIDLRSEGPTPAPRVTLDLATLNRVAEATAVARYAQSILLERGDFNGRVISLRRDDMRVLASVLQLSETDLYASLDRWGVLVLTEPSIDVRDTPASVEARVSD